MYRQSKAFSPKTYLSYENIPCRIERFRRRRFHGFLHECSYLPDDDLHDAHVVEDCNDTAEVDHYREHLCGVEKLEKSI